MDVIPVRHIAMRVLMIVIFFTMVSAALHQWAFARGLWLATVWQAVSVAALALCSGLLTPPITRRRAWLLAGAVLIKFPLLYALGYAGLRLLQPGPIGLVTGITVPWAVLVLMVLRASYLPVTADVPSAGGASA